MPGSDCATRLETQLGDCHRAGPAHRRTAAVRRRRDRSGLGRRAWRRRAHHRAGPVHHRPDDSAASQDRRCRRQRRGRAVPDHDEDQGQVHAGAMGRPGAAVAGGPRRGSGAGVMMRRLMRWLDDRARRCDPGDVESSPTDSVAAECRTSRLTGETTCRLTRPPQFRTGRCAIGDGRTSAFVWVSCLLVQPGRQPRRFTDDGLLPTDESWLATRRPYTYGNVYIVVCVNAATGAVRDAPEDVCVFDGDEPSLAAAAAAADRGGVRRGRPRAW